MRDLYIFGTGGLAREMAQLSAQIDNLRQRWRFRGYIAETEAEVGRTLTYGAVIGTDDWFEKSGADADVVIGVGYPHARRKIAERFGRCSSLAWPNLVHPTAQVDWSVTRIGIGNVITSNCVMTCDLTIGSFNLLNWSVTVGHDAQIGSFNVVNPGSSISGCVRMYDEILIGTGSQILEHMEIASRSTIGAGAVVTKSILCEGGTYLGIPARPKP